MKKYSVAQLVLLFTPFVFAFAFGLDIYIPIIPDMTHIFHTTPELVQLTLSLFLFVTGVGQLFIGPISDQFGRRPILYISAAFYTIGDLACAFSPNIVCLIIARVISALGACGMIVLAFAMVRDLYSGKEGARVFSLLHGAIGISPTFAPILGGYLAVYFGWRSIFIFLAVIGLVSMFIIKQYIPETHRKDKRIKVNRHILDRYWSLLKNRHFFVYANIVGFAEGIFFCFFSVSSIIIIGILKVPTQDFGFYFAAFGLVIALGGLAAGKIVYHIGIENMVRLGISLLFVGGVSMLAWYYLAGLSLQGFLIPMVISCTGAIFLVGSGAAAAMEPFEHIAGTAAAAVGCFEFGIAAICGYILMRFPVHSTESYGIGILLSGMLALSLFLNRSKRLKV